MTKKNKYRESVREEIKKLYLKGLSLSEIKELVSEEIDDIIDKHSIGELSKGLIK